MTAEFFFARGAGGKVAVCREHFEYLLRFFQTERELNPQLCDRVCAVLAAQSLRYPLETLRFLMSVHIEDLVVPHVYDDAVAFRLIFDLLVNTKSSSALNELNLLGVDSPANTRRSSDDERAAGRPVEFHLEAFAAPEAGALSKEHSRSPDKPIQLAITDEGFRIELLPFDEHESHGHRFFHAKKPQSGGLLPGLALSNRGSPTNAGSVDNLAVLEDSRVYRSLFDFRVAVVQKLLDRAAGASDPFVLTNVFKVVEMMLREIATIADYQKLTITLFYERKNVTRLFHVAKAAHNSTIFALWADIMMLLLGVHVEMFGANERRGQALQQSFIRSCADLIEDFDEYLREEDTFFVLPNGRERPLLSFRKLALVKLIRGCLQLNYAQLNLSLSIFSVFTTIYVV